VRNRLLYDYHAKKNKQDANKNFRLFILSQIISYGALLLLFLGGLVLVIMAVKTLV
jgi:hypothetical protein